METNLTTIETQNHLDVIQAQSGLVLDPVKAIAEANKRVEFFKQIKTISLKMTAAGDWVLEGGKPYLQGSGCEKLKPVWGIEIKDAKIEPSLKDGLELYKQNGEIAFECLVTGRCKVTGEESVFIGGRSSRDGFFSSQKNLDIVDVYKAAYTNAEVQAVMRLLGMRNLSVDDLKEAGIDSAKVGSVAFKGEMKERERSEEANAKAKEIGQWLIEMNDGDKDLAADELASMTTFKGRDDKMVPGKRSIRDLSEKQIDILYGKAKKAHEEFIKNRQEA